MTCEHPPLAASASLHPSKPVVREVEDFPSLVVSNHKLPIVALK